MKEKMKRQRMQVILGAVLAAFVICMLPQHRAAAASRIRQISMGGNHSAAVKTDGSLWLWGDNEYGQLGNGSTEDSAAPVKVMTGVRSVSLGGYHSAAVKTDGSLWLWGSNESGQLGNGNSGKGKYSTTPVKVMAEVQSVSLGRSHSAALKTDGSLWLWGDNSYGELGNESTKRKSRPVKVMTGVQSVSLGDRYSAAVKADGSLWLWGDNEGGQLGNGKNGEGMLESAPVKIMDGVKTVDLGQMVSAAVKKDGSLWTWGASMEGALGHEDSRMSNKPVKILTGAQSVSLGNMHGAALKKDGSLWMWGGTEWGQGGYKEGYNSTVPMKIMTAVREISMGGVHSAAVKKDGSLWLWGANDEGQLGKGYKENDLFANWKPVKITMPGSGTAKINIMECKITLLQKKYKYTGKAIKPLPTVKYNGKTLKNKTDYTLTYKDNKKRGTATIVIKGKGAYTGQSQIKFTIRK